MREKAILALEDGTIYEGTAFGAIGEAAGEIVFNTSMTGYQEILTDPSYAGQIVTMTYPHIGNCGVNSEDYESRGPFVEGFVVRECSRIYSNWRAEDSLENFLNSYGIVGIQDIDTRALTKHIRSEGAMKSILSSIDLNPQSLVEKAKASPGLIGIDLVKDVTIDKPYVWRETRRVKRFHVVAFDFGIKRNILRSLETVGCKITVVPASTKAEEVLALNPDGILLSNGPGDPAGVPYAIETTGKLLGKKPIFGICLGHQILALALGGKTYKLKFGHRGGNQPVKNLLTGGVEITAQNHGFAVDQSSLRVSEREWRVGKTIPIGGWGGKTEFGSIEITHINLNDGTVEGLRCLDIPAFSVQYHPEASPGPHDSRYLFDQFIELMEEAIDSR
ncbi:MAG: glutamine-hydrolyzing carbamoyl-phosphate synthase small subunit [Actinomycetota bacterium]